MRPNLPDRREQALVPQLPENSSVKLLGCGGVGQIVARFGGLFLASLHVNVRLVLIDGDHFENSNAGRMFFSGYGNKAEVTRADLLDRFRDSTLSLIAVPEFVMPQNIGRLIHNGDIVILAVDNHATRKLISDYCGKLNDVCLISGGNDGVGPDGSGRTLRGTYGNCQVYIRRQGADVTPSLTRYHPEIANPVDHLPTEQSCTELVQSVPQILITNVQTAAALLQGLWLYLCGALHYSELAFDIADGLMRPTPLPGPTSLVRERGPSQRTTS